MGPRIVYLHGFASSPASRKARFFAERLRAEGRTLEVPDLAGGDFENLTIGNQLARIEALLADDSAILIGSSLGGYLAALYASLHPTVTRLVLLAPAFGFARHWSAILGTDGLEDWRRTGIRAVYHFGERCLKPLRYTLVEESFRWDPEPLVQQPTLLYHGEQDTVVPPEISIAYAARQPNVKLTLLLSDHELTSALTQIWTHAGPFLLRPT